MQTSWQVQYIVRVSSFAACAVFGTWVTCVCAFCDNTAARGATLCWSFVQFCTAGAIGGEVATAMAQTAFQQYCTGHGHCRLEVPHSTLYTLHSTLIYTALYTLHFALHTLHHSTLHTQDSRLYILHRTLHTPHSTLCTSHPPLHIPRFTLHPLPFTLHTLHSPHPTPHPTLHAPHWLHTLHSTLHNSDSTLHTLHSTLCTPHFHSLLHTTCHTLHFTPCTLHFTLHTLHSPHSRLDSLQWYGNRARSFKTVVMSCLTKVFYVMFIRVGGLNQVDTFCIFLHFEWFLLMGSYFMVYSPCRASFALAAWAFSMKNARITSFTSSAVMKKEEGALLLGQKSSNKKNQKIRKPLRDMTTMKQQQHLTTTSRSCKVRSLESRDGNTMQELLK